MRCRLGATRWPSRPVPASVPTRSSRRSAPVAWARSTARGTRGWGATSRSRSCPRPSPGPGPPDPLRAGGAGGRGLNHPNITAVYDVGKHDGAPYVVTELLEGETLREPPADGRDAGAQGDRLCAPDRARASPRRTRKGSSTAT